MYPTEDCDDCKPGVFRRQLDSIPLPTIVLSILPFVLTWIAAAFIAQRKLFPILASEDQHRNELPEHNKSNAMTPISSSKNVGRFSARSLACLVFFTSIGLSAVLVELLMCEISNTLNPAARNLALRVTLSSLLVLSVIVTPALEIHGLVKTGLAPPMVTTSTRQARSRTKLGLEVVLLLLWLVLFWYMPQASVLRESLESTKLSGSMRGGHSLSEACLERIGIIGISLMASLSGFAAVSSLWQTFGTRHRLVREMDLARKEAGLTATSEMLSAKQSRLRAIQRKLSDAAASSEQSGFMSRVVGSFRGNPEEQEVKALQTEVSGLETMRRGLSSSLSSLRARYAEQQRSQTNSGKVLSVCNSAFAIFCAYRIAATSLASLRRWWQPNLSLATSDPINNLLALLTTHWDSNLDRAAWSRQISFLLSGIMLLASFNAVLQTFRLFSRFLPQLVRRAQTSLPLIISQIAGTYVISSALLLRSNLPEEVGGVISEALGAPLEARFVDGWFESWFLVAVGLTATGILIGRKVGGGDDGVWDDFDEGIEMGSKRS